MFNTCRTLETEARVSLQLTMSARVVEGGGLALVSCLTLLANLLLWLAILIYRPLRSVVNILLLSLSAVGFLEVAIGVIDAHNVVLGRLLFSCATCKFMAFTASVMEVVSITSLCVLATNRYVRVCQPTYYQTFYTRTSVWLYILALWTLAILWASMPFVGWGQYQYLPHLLLCSIDTDNFKLLRVAGRVAFAIMVLVMICSYITIFYRLSRKIESFVTLSSYGGQVLKSNALPSMRNTPIIYAFRKLSAIVEVTDSDITSDMISSKCSHRNKSNGGTLTLASSVSGLESNTTGPGNNDRSFSPRDARHKKDNEEDPTSLPAHIAGRVCKSRRSLDVFPSDSTVDLTDNNKFCYEKRFALSLFLVTVVNLVSFLPSFTLSKLNQSDSVSPAWKVACLLLGHMDSMLNPLLYGWGNSRIRTGYKQIFKQCMKWGHCKGSAQVEPG